MLKRKNMEYLIRSSDPDSIYDPLNEDSVLLEDYKNIQTIRKFLNWTGRNKITPTRHTFHVYYIGEMSSKFKKLSERLFEFIRNFFMMPVVVKGNLIVDPCPISKKNCIIRTSDSKDAYYVKVLRRRPTSGRMIFKQKGHKNTMELDSGDVLSVLKTRVENDTFTVFGITSHNI